MMEFTSHRDKLAFDKVYRTTVGFSYCIVKETKDKGLREMRGRGGRGGGGGGEGEKKGMETLDTKPIT